MFVGFFEIFLHLLDSFRETGFDFVGPDDLTAVEDTLTGVVLDPLRSFLYGVISDAICKRKSYRSLHHGLNFSHPVLYR